MGRTKLYDESLRLPLSGVLRQRLDAVLDNGETRLDVIRAAIEREVKRRERKAGLKPNDPRPKLAPNPD